MYFSTADRDISDPFQLYALHMPHIYKPYELEFQHPTDKS